MGNYASKIKEEYVKKNVESYKDESIVNLIAFYQPQHHIMPEHDKGRDENVSALSDIKSFSQVLDNDYQYYSSKDSGCYPLSCKDIQKKQIELAKLYGIGGFCFNFYWVAGDSILERSTKRYLNDSSLDHPFCLCWVNGILTSEKDYLDRDVRITQEHSESDDIAFIEHISTYLKDERCIKVDGKPLLLVSRPSIISNVSVTTSRWREWCRKNGVGEIYLLSTEVLDALNPVDIGFDDMMESPRDNVPMSCIVPAALSVDDNRSVYGWKGLYEHCSDLGVDVHKGVFSSWDNTVCRRFTSIILSDGSPIMYQNLLVNAIGDVSHKHFNNRGIIFINSWNGVVDGVHLEPEQKYGYAYLEATRLALVRTAVMNQSEKYIRPSCIAIVVHAFYLDVFCEILAYLKEINNIDFKLFVTTPINLVDRVRSLLNDACIDSYIMGVENRGRDVLPFLKILPRVYKEGFSTLIKVHTKKSNHRDDGAIWCKELLDSMLVPHNIDKALDLLASRKQLGIISSDDHILPMTDHWISNENRVRQLSARVGINDIQVEEEVFAAGTMFFARLDALLPLMNLALSDEDFEEEAGQLDGALNHAIERVITFSAKSCGFNVSGLNSSINLQVDYKYAESSGG